jgi:DNA polymerase-3 subunit beta
MNLTAERAPLLAALAKITAIVERKNTIPILGHVLMSAHDGKLTIKGTDLDIEVTCTISANVETGGETTIPADMISNIVKKAPSGALISMSEENGHLIVKFGRSRFQVATLPPGDFPAMANAEYNTEFELPAYQVQRLFGKTAFAMSTEETQYYLNGVYLHPTSEGITAVATNGHKMAKVVYEQDADFPGVIVPRKTVAELRKSVSDDPVAVSVSETKIRFVSGETVIVSKVVDGSFPDYARVIPKGYPNAATVVASDMRAASDRVAMVSDDKARSVVLKMSEGAIGLHSRGNNSIAEDEVDATVDGEFIEIAFNSRSLAEALAQCDAGDVRIEYKGSMDPCLIKPEEDEGFVAIIMPWRV